MTYQDIVNIIRNAANYVNPNGFFIHGRKTDGSLNYNKATPQILLLEPQPNTVNNNSSFIETITFPIVFVTQDSPESTELNREDLKQEMYLLSRKLLAKIDEEPLLQNVNFTGGQPEIRQLSATLTGFSYLIQITYPLSECSLDFDLPPSIKLFATQTTVASGTTVQIGWIADNVNSVNITPFGVLQGQFGFVNAVVNSTITFNGSATNDNGTATDSITIFVGAACLDATAVLKDSANNTISTTEIASGDTEDIPAPDGTLELFNTVPTLIQTETVRSGQTKSGTIADVTYTDSDSSIKSVPYNTPLVCTPIMPLAVDFSVDDATPDTNQSITFTDLTVGATQWLWDFGDGTSSDLQNPTKTYKYAGTYTVTLCATNGSISGKEVKTNYIVVTLQTIIQTNLQAHYKALVGAMPPNATLVSGAISQWDDDTINAYHVTQGSVTARPLYSVSEITSPDGTVYGGGTFDGINDFVANAAAGFTRGVNTTMFMLFRQNNIQALGSRLLFGTSLGGASISNLASNPQMRLANGASIDSLMAYPLGNYFVLKAQYSNSGNARVGINNLIDRNIANTGANTDTGLVIGGNSAGSAQAFMTFIEGAVYSDNPSAGDVTNILNYFKAKFGLWN